jgi:hypothetical protein
MMINNIGIVQNGNQYCLFLPTNICVAQLVTPPDNAYLADAEALKYITRALAIRWGVYEKQKYNHG